MKFEAEIILIDTANAASEFTRTYSFTVIIQRDVISAKEADELTETQ